MVTSTTSERELTAVSRNAAALAVGANAGEDVTEEVAPSAVGFGGVVNRAAFAGAVAEAFHGVTGRSTQPVQNNVLLQTHSQAAGGGWVRVVGTDLEFLQVAVELPAEAAVDGSVTLPAGLLGRLAGRLVGEEVCLASAVGAQGGGDLLTDGAMGALSSGPSRCRLVGLSAVDFEELPAVDGGAVVVVDPAEFRRALQAVVRAVSVDASRSLLGGVLVEVDEVNGGVLRLVATDTHRLVLREVPAEFRGEVSEALQAGGEGSVVLAPILVAAVLRSLGNAEEAAELAFGADGAAVEVRGLTTAAGAEVVLRSRVIQGQFPNYGRIIPDTSDLQLTVDAGALAGAVGRVLLVGAEDTGGVVLEHKGEGLTVSARQVCVGSMEEDVEGAELVGASDWKAAFSGRYVLDGLADLAGEVVIEATGELNPIVMLPVGGEVGRALYVLMPMH